MILHNYIRVLKHDLEPHILEIKESKGFWNDLYNVYLYLFKDNTKHSYTVFPFSDYYLLDELDTIKEYLNSKNIPYTIKPYPFEIFETNLWLKS